MKRPHMPVSLAMLAVAFGFAAGRRRFRRRRGASRSEGTSPMRRSTGILLAGLLLLCGDAFCAPDGFSGVRCGSDIPKALRGRSMPDGTIVAIEGRHKDLRLEHLGADELDRGWSLISWRICGDEFMLIQDNRSIARDVLKVPPHSKSAPESSGPCTMHGAEILGVVVAILDKTSGGADLPATIAWRVDDKAGKFIPQPIAGLLCSRVGIITVDGGM